MGKDTGSALRGYRPHASGSSSDSSAKGAEEVEELVEKSKAKKRAAQKDE